MSFTRGSGTGRTGTPGGGRIGMPGRAAHPGRVPVDPAIGQALRMLSLTRRGFLRTMGVGGGAALLAACGIGGNGSSAPTARATTPAATGGDLSGELNFSNWPFYIDTSEEDETEHQTLLDFQEEYGVTVNYFEDINSNDEYFGRVRNQLANGEDIGRDIIVLTDWMAGRLIRLGWAEELDHSRIPNFANLREALQSPSFDPERAYSLPWQSGLTGIGYNPEATGRELTSINDLFDEELAGRVTFLSEMRDTMGLIMASMEIDPLDHAFADYERAIQRLQGAVDDGQVRQFTGNEYTTDLAAGNIAAAIAWSGDIIQLQFDNPDLQFVVPDEGALLWSDNMLIPANAQNKANAETFMDFVYRPAIAAQIAAWVNYITPVDGAQEAMEDVDPELVAFDLIFPPDEMLAGTFDFKQLDEEEEEEYQNLFQGVIGA